MSTSVLSKEKQCSICKIVKNASEFYPRKRRKIVNYRITDDFYYTLTSSCKLCEIERSRKYLPHKRIYDREKRRLRKNNIIEFYSKGENKCICCGEKEFTFLTIDHVDNNGTKHRKLVSEGYGGDRFYKWLVKSDFPLGFQVMCFNCNHGKFLNNGICPHKLK